MKGRVLILFTVAVSLLFLPAAVMAQGKVIIKPTVITSWKKDSNFFKAETNEREVYTYLLQPGIELGYDTGKSQVSVKYTLDAHYYKDQDTLQAGWLPADTEDYVGHTGELNLSTSPTDRLTLGLAESYNRTRDPASADRLSNSVDREKYDINRLTPSLSYAFGPKFSFNLKYRMTETDYDLVTKEDSSEKRPIFDLVYNLNQTTALDLEYQRWERDNKLGTSDFTSDQAKLILRKQYKYLSFEAGGGHQERDYDDPVLLDVDQFTYSLGVKGQNPPGPGSKPKSYFSLMAEQNLSDSSQYRARSYSLNAGHIFMEKLPFDMKAEFQESDYKTTTGLTPSGITAIREDDSYNLEGSLGYIYNEYFLFKVAAGYEDRDSNLAGTDYDNRYLMATINFSYDLSRK